MAEVLERLQQAAQGRLTGPKYTEGIGENPKLKTVGEFLPTVGGACRLPLLSWVAAPSLKPRPEA